MNSEPVDVLGVLARAEETVKHYSFPQYVDEVRAAHAAIAELLAADRELDRLMLSGTAAQISAAVDRRGVALAAIKGVSNDQ